MHEKIEKYLNGGKTADKTKGKSEQAGPMKISQELFDLNEQIRETVSDLIGGSEENLENIGLLEVSAFSNSFLDTVRFYKRLLEKIANKFEELGMGNPHISADRLPQVVDSIRSTAQSLETSEDSLAEIVAKFS